MRYSLPCALALLAPTLLAPPAFAAPGPHLSWDRCWGDGQVANKTFACNVSSGSELLVLSYESPTPASDRSGVEIVMGLIPPVASYPAWWEVFGPGRCRLSALTTAFTGDPGSLCVDPYQGLALGGIGALRLDIPLPGRARLLMVVAVPPPALWTVGPGTENFLLRLQISHVGTTGAGACAGCGTPMNIILENLKLVGPAGSTDIVLTSNVPGNAHHVTWQGLPTPTLRSSWGSVKALYH